METRQVAINKIKVSHKYLGILAEFVLDRKKDETKIYDWNGGETGGVVNVTVKRQSGETGIWDVISGWKDGFTETRCRKHAEEKAIEMISSNLDDCAEMLGNELEENIWEEDGDDIFKKMFDEDYIYVKKEKHEDEKKYVCGCFIEGKEYKGEEEFEGYDKEKLDKIAKEEAAQSAERVYMAGYYRDSELFAKAEG